MKIFLIFGLIATVLSVDVNAENRRVRLSAEVTVQTETLRLSDLLPADAGTQLKAAGDRVSLGRAPRIGSLRVLTANQLLQVFAEIPLSTKEIDIPEQIVVRHLGWPLETETLRRTLAHSQLTDAIDFSRVKIVLPPGFTTLTRDPQFEVTALNYGSDGHQLQASMRCLDRTACGSFLAEVLNVPADSVPWRGLKPINQKLAGPSLSSGAGPVLVHPGHLAMLVIEGDGFRITQSVMPHKPARLGDVVRVSEPRTHRSWIARVSGDGILHTSRATGNEEAR